MLVQVLQTEPIGWEVSQFIVSLLENQGTHSDPIWMPDTQEHWYLWTEDGYLNPKSKSTLPLPFCSVQAIDCKMPIYTFGNNLLYSVYRNFSPEISSQTHMGITSATMCTSLSPVKLTLNQPSQLCVSWQIHKQRAQHIWKGPRWEYPWHDSAEPQSYQIEICRS